MFIIKLVKRIISAIVSLAIAYAVVFTISPSTTEIVNKYLCQGIDWVQSRAEAPVNTEVTATPVPTQEPIATASPVPVTSPEPTNVPVVINDQLRIHQLSIGCANATLIEYGDYVVFVDGGTDKTWNKTRKYLSTILGERKLSMYVVTCYKQANDQNSGRILEQFCDEQTLFMGPSAKMRQKYNGIGIPYTQMYKGMEIRLGDISITCVGPSKIIGNGTESKDALNFILKFGEHKFFFGSNYVQSEAVLAEFGELVKDVTVLQFPGNGLELSSSRFAMSAELYAHANPSVVLVPANSSGKAQAFAKNLGSDAMFFDNGNGNIVIESNGIELQVYTNVQSGQFSN